MLLLPAVAVGVAVGLGVGAAVSFEHLPDPAGVRVHGVA